MAQIITANCCSSICISESDKLLTVCDILTVSRGAAGSSAAANTFNPAASQFPKLQFLHQREKISEMCQRRQTLMLSVVAAKVGFERLSVAKIGKSKTLLRQKKKRGEVFARGSQQQSVVD